MKTIFVTGKSGSGKSTFSKLLADKLNFKYVDVDKIGHKIYENPLILQKIEELFGKEIYNEHGEFERKRLGHLVFSQKDSQKVKEFNIFTWSCMKQYLTPFLKENAIFDWIKLPYTDLWEENSCKILVTTKNDNKRFEEIQKRDKISKEYLQLRENSTAEYDLKNFDFIFENDYSQENMIKKVNEIAKKIQNSATIKILGTQSPFCQKNKACPSYLLSKGTTRILLDCGSGSHRFFNMNDLNGLNIFISHLHKDHFNDISNYQYSSFVLKNQKRIKDKINIYLPEYNSNVSQIIINEPNTYSNFFEISENVKYKIGDFGIEFCKIEHSPQVETYAIKLTLNELKIVYSSDVSYSSKNVLTKFAKNADLFICEASLLEEHNFPEICGHLTAKQASLIAKEANVKHMILTHFWPEEKYEKIINEAKQNFENVELAQEEKERYLF